MSDDDGAAARSERLGTWLAVLAIVVGAALLLWALNRPYGYAEFGWFASSPPPQAALVAVDTTSPQLVVVALVTGPLLAGLGGGFLLGRRRG